METAAILRALGQEVILTRTSDSGLESPEDKTIRQKKITDMKARLAIMDSRSDGLFISIHLNKYTDAAPKGAQVFYSGNREESPLLAQSVQSAIREKLQTDNDRKIKKAGADTMLLHKAAIPAVIVECGFLSNPEELELLKNAEYQRKMAVCIVAGIMEYLESEN